MTRTLEVVPRQWKVIETVREKFSCRDCEKISQAPAPFHLIPRGGAGPSLLAMIVFEKFGQHLPLNRQADRYALEGVPIALSTMADAVGAVCVWQQEVEQALSDPKARRSGLIPSIVDQNLWAQSRIPMDMRRHGWFRSLFQASQQ